MYVDTIEVSMIVVSMKNTIFLSASYSIHYTQLVCGAIIPVLEVEGLMRSQHRSPTAKSWREA